jgi:hypothetical protein
MNAKPTTEGDVAAIFARLTARGIEYVEIKKLVSFYLPHARLYLERHFGPHTAPQIVRQIDRWRKLLSNDFILQKEQRQELEKTLSQWEWFAWNALIEGSLSGLGEWSMSRRWLPTHKDPKPRYVHPATQILAVHHKTGEKRSVVIPGDSSDEVSMADAWREAFTKLGLLDLLLERKRKSRLVSARRSQAWPIFTKVVIPRLYEFMLPYYAKRGHVWSDKEENLKRNAFFPKELLTDMREILQIEHPDAFSRLTIDQLKANIQRHRARRLKVPNLQNRPRLKK